MSIDAQYADAVDAALERLNTYVSDRALLEYQRQIVTTGTFEVPSPLGPGTLRPSGCFIFKSGEIAYRMSETPALWLLAAGTSSGFPLVQLYDQSTQEILWSRGRGPEARWRQFWRQIKARAPRQAHVLGDDGVHVLVGHPNFAHSMWNELPALHQIAQRADVAAYASKLHIHPTFEPLVSLDGFLAGTPLADRLAPRVSQRDVPAYHDGIVTRMGAQRMSTEFRVHLTKIIAREADPAICAALESLILPGKPCVWIACRTDARTAVNQREFYQDLLSRACQQFGPCTFLIDGFSYPRDYADADYLHHREKLEDRAEEIKGYIDGLVSALDIEASLINVSNLPLCDAIHVGRHAQYYVAPAGTIQHKIAWVYNIPGAIHSNHPSTLGTSLKWYSNQLEAGVTPISIPRDYIEEIDSNRKGLARNRNVDYRITDIEAASEVLLADMARVLGKDGA